MTRKRYSESSLYNVQRYSPNMKTVEYMRHLIAKGEIFSHLSEEEQALMEERIKELRLRLLAFLMISAKLSAQETGLVLGLSTPRVEMLYRELPKEVHLLLEKISPPAQRTPQPQTPSPPEDSCMGCWEGCVECQRTPGNGS